MTKLEALTDLLAKVKAGEWARDMTGPKPFDPRGMTFAALAYEGSLDAAMALHEAVLQGAEYGVHNIGSLPGRFDAVIWLNCREYIGESDTPARAWLIAILEALIAMEKNDDQ